MSSTEDRVKRIVCEQLGVGEEEVTLEASFIDDLGADSLDTVKVMTFEEFEIEILMTEDCYCQKCSRLYRHIVLIFFNGSGKASSPYWSRYRLSKW